MRATFLVVMAHRFQLTSAAAKAWPRPDSGAPLQLTSEGGALPSSISSVLLQLTGHRSGPSRSLRLTRKPGPHTPRTALDVSTQARVRASLDVSTQPPCRRRGPRLVSIQRSTRRARSWSSVLFDSPGMEERLSPDDIKRLLQLTSQPLDDPSIYPQGSALQLTGIRRIHNWSPGSLRLASLCWKVTRSTPPRSLQLASRWMSMPECMLQLASPRWKANGFTVRLIASTHPPSTGNPRVGLLRPHHIASTHQVTGVLVSRRVGSRKASNTSSFNSSSAIPTPGTSPARGSFDSPATRHLRVRLLDFRDQDTGNHPEGFRLTSALAEGKPRGRSRVASFNSPSPGRRPWVLRSRWLQLINGPLAFSRVQICGKKLPEQIGDALSRACARSITNKLQLTFRSAAGKPAPGRASTHLRRPAPKDGVEYVMRQIVFSTQGRYANYPRRLQLTSRGGKTVFGRIMLQLRPSRTRHLFRLSDPRDRRMP